MNEYQVQPFYMSAALARRQRGITQSDLARQIDCKQSAISMFERGHAQALAIDKQKAAAALLEISWSDTAQINQPGTLGGFCPQFDCPSNYPYLTNGRLFVWPEKTTDHATFCRYCGEVRENTCPGCGTFFKHGACCTECGTPYVTTPATPDNLDAWISEQRHTIEYQNKQTTADQNT